MATLRQNCNNQEYYENLDGFKFIGGTNSRDFTFASGSLVLVGNGAGPFTFVSRSAKLGQDLFSASLVTQTVQASQLATLSGSVISIPSSFLQVGTTFIYDIAIDKTAAGTASSSFDFRIGTTGTTADASVLLFNQTGAPTGVADSGLIHIVVTIRGPLGASCIAQGHLMLSHNLEKTGLGTLDTNVDVTSGTFNSTTAGLQASLSVTTPASTVLDHNLCVTHVYNI